MPDFESFTDAFDGLEFCLGSLLDAEGQRMCKYRPILVAAHKDFCAFVVRLDAVVAEGTALQLTC